MLRVFPSCSTTYKGNLSLCLLQADSSVPRHSPASFRRAELSSWDRLLSNRQERSLSVAMGTQRKSRSEDVILENKELRKSRH